MNTASRQNQFRTYSNTSGSRTLPQLDFSKQMNLGRLIYGLGFQRNGMSAKSDLLFLPNRWGMQQLTGCYRFVTAGGIEFLESNSAVKFARHRLSALAKKPWADIDAVRPLLVATQKDPDLNWHKANPSIYIHPSKLRYDRVILNMAKSKSIQVAASVLWTPHLPTPPSSHLPTAPRTPLETQLPETQRSGLRSAGSQPQGPRPPEPSPGLSHRPLSRNLLNHPQQCLNFEPV